MYFNKEQKSETSKKYTFRDKIYEFNISNPWLVRIYTTFSGIIIEIAEMLQPITFENLLNFE